MLCEVQFQQMRVRAKGSEAGKARQVLWKVMQYGASPVSCCTATDTAGCLVGGLLCLIGHLLQAGSTEKLAQSKTLGKKEREFID